MLDFLTLAMATGVTDRLWEMADIMMVLEDWEKRNETGRSGLRLRLAPCSAGAL